MKPLPNNTEAEKSILGAVLKNSENIYKINLKPIDFYNTNNRAIFNCMKSLQENGNKIDIISLSEKLKFIGKFDEIGAYYLTGLEDFTDVNLEEWVKIVKEKSDQRSIIRLTQNVQSDGYKMKPITELKNKLMDGITEIQTGEENKILTINEIKKKLIKEKKRFLRGELNTIKTGY